MKTRFATLFVIVTAAAIAGAQPRPADRPAPSVPSDFRTFTDMRDVWAPPWVSVQRASQKSAMRSFHNPVGKATGGSIPVRLDDGTTGTLKVMPKPKRETDYENFLIQVLNSRGAEVLSVDLYASYAELDITPIDLVGGPGDELVVVHMKTHASPPTGHYMSVWRLSGQKLPLRILQDQDVSNLVGTSPNDCARWKRSALVNLSEPKPRSLLLRPEFGVLHISSFPAGECRIGDSSYLAELRRPIRLRFDGIRYPSIGRF